MKKRVVASGIVSLVVVAVVVWTFHPYLRRYRGVRNLDVDFYGRVMSVDGQPVRDLDVTVRVKDVSFLSHFLMVGYGSKFRNYVMKTDADGRFSLENERGIGVIVLVNSTDAYIFNPGDRQSSRFIVSPMDTSYPRWRLDRKSRPIPEESAIIPAVPRDQFKVEQPADSIAFNALIADTYYIPNYPLSENAMAAKKIIKCL